MWVVLENIVLMETEMRFLICVSADDSMWMLSKALSLHVPGKDNVVYLQVLCLE